MKTSTSPCHVEQSHADLHQVRDAHALEEGHDRNAAVPFLDRAQEEVHDRNAAVPFLEEENGYNENPLESHDPWDRDTLYHPPY